MDEPRHYGFQTHSFSFVFYVLVAKRSIACDSTTMPKVSTTREMVLQRGYSAVSAIGSTRKQCSPTKGGKISAIADGDVLKYVERQGHLPHAEGEQVSMTDTCSEGVEESNRGCADDTDVTADGTMEDFVRDGASGGSPCDVGEDTDAATRCSGNI